jgi:hypothetical protein
VERVRCSRADLQSAPGRLGHHVSRHYDRGGRCSLDWDRRRRVTPVQTASQEAWPEAEPLGWNNSLRREPWWNAVRRARSKRARAASVRCGGGTLRLPAFRLPFLFEGRQKQVASGGEGREILSIRTWPDTELRRGSRCEDETGRTLRPREAGEGDHWSSRSERTVVEGAHDSQCCCRFRTVPPNRLK